MSTNTNDDPMDLDFTDLFAEETKVKEPEPTPQQHKELADEAIIGESKLTSNVFAPSIIYSPGDPWVRHTGGIV